MKRELLIIIFCTLKFLCFSQKDSAKVSNHSVYLEIGGVGGYGSLNYEKNIFHKKDVSLTLRLGMSAYHLMDYRNKLNPDVLIPLLINTRYGKNHQVEFGIGETVSSIVYANTSDYKQKRVFKLSTVFSIGYRYQKNTKGIFYRIAYTPIFEFNQYYKNWAGLSCGYSF